MLITGHTDLHVETKTGLGGTQICFEALINKQIDMYPEYTGTGLLVILQPPRSTVDRIISSRDSVYYFVKNGFEKNYQITWLKPIGFNNAYALMMRKEAAERLRLRTISDLKSYLDR